MYNLDIFMLNLMYYSSMMNYQHGQYYFYYTYKYD